MEEDIFNMSEDQLREKLWSMRLAIRRDWQSIGHDLCWYKPELWQHDPLYMKTNPQVPCKPEFLKKCEEYRDSFENVD